MLHDRPVKGDGIKSALGVTISLLVNVAYILGRRHRS